MKIAQELYEGIELEGQGAVGLITYMRTDSLRISDEAAAEAEELIRSNYSKDYLPPSRRVYKSRSGAQDAHEAIRPTMPRLTPEEARGSLTAEQYKLYKLIWSRFIASQMANALLDVYKRQLMGMMSTILLIFCAFAFGGIYSKSGCIQVILEKIAGCIRSVGSLIASTFVSTIFMSIVTGSSYLAILVPGEMFSEPFERFGLHKKNLSRTLEDAGTCVVPLVPWAVAGTYMATTLGVPTVQYLSLIHISRSRPGRAAAEPNLPAATATTAASAALRRATRCGSLPPSTGIRF